MKALAASNDPPTLFVHGGVLSRLDPECVEKPVTPLTKPQVRLALSDAADFVNEITGKDGEVTQKPAYPRGEVVESVQEHPGGWPEIPELRGVADVPVMTSASGLLTHAGYDRPSGIYLLPSGYHDVDPVPPNPTDGDIGCALELLQVELLGDFPFLDKASKANTLAMFLEPFVRDLIKGPTPLYHIDAPQEGTGKSLLAQTWGRVVFGRPLCAMGEPPPGDWQKTTLAALMEAPRYIFFDNLSQTLDSGNLAAALTAPEMKGRLLGFSKIVTAPVRCTWVSSGNNVSMSRELIRRTVPTRMVSNRKHAYEGKKYKHVLPEWAELNRGKLVWACLTLCQAWVARGKPPGRKLLGGYEVWSAVIDGILQTAKIEDLLSNMDDFRASAIDDADDWDAFVGAWWEEHRDRWVTARDLFPLAQNNDMLGNVRGDGNDDSQRKKLGRAIKKQRDAVFADGYKIVAPDRDTRRKANNKVNQYRLVGIGERLDLALELPDPGIPD